jgi:N-acetylated-alpha-linked acidic dipeptidase
MGSGSDYTAFYHHLGIPSLNLSFSGEDDGGVYHSIYDSFRWFTTFSDSAFVYGRALAQTAGTTVLRLANADLLPFEITGLSGRLGDNLKEVQELLKTTRDSIEEQNRELDESTFVAVNDPRHPIVPPVREEVVPHLNFAPLENAADRLKHAADDYEQALQQVAGKGGAGVSPGRTTQLNAQLLQVERLLAPEPGLPRRPWYRQVLSAPGWYTGYSPKILPGVREAIEAKRWPEAEAEAARLGQALDAESAAIDRISEMLRRLASR